MDLILRELLKLNSCITLKATFALIVSPACIPILTEDPNRVKPRNDKDDPQDIKLKTEQEDPILEIDLREREEAHCTKSITLNFMQLPMWVSPITETADPTFTKLLSDILEPKLRKSHTEQALPKRVNDLSERLDPISVSAIMESLQTEPI
jgi:hypothetical protein